MNSNKNEPQKAKIKQQLARQGLALERKLFICRNTQGKIEMDFV